MSTYEQAALAIMQALHTAELELLGHAARAYDGVEGTVQDVKLCEIHGLIVTFDKERWYPVSTITVQAPV